MGVKDYCGKFTVGSVQKDILSKRLFENLVFKGKTAS